MKGTLLLKRIAGFFAASLALGFAGPVFAVIDNLSPAVGAISPMEATAGVETTFSATYHDPDPSSGIERCELFLDETTFVDTMTLSSNIYNGTSTIDYAFIFSTSGYHRLSAKCRDRQGNWGYGAVTAINVAVRDTEPPTVGAIRPITAFAGATTTYSSTYADNVGVTLCQLIEGAITYGNMTIGEASSTRRQLLPAGTHRLQAKCRDATGNWGYGQATAVTVFPPDTSAPSVALNRPNAVAAMGVTTTIYAIFSDNAGVTGCALYVGNVNQGAMALSGDTASKNYAFSRSGSYAVQVRCRDAAGNEGLALGTMLVSFPSGVAYGSLVKQICPADADVNHPCKAIYYYGSDGKRHAFSNERVYYTWYADFSTVQEISDVAMANIPLGRNVNYRPGIRLVKFPSVPNVYGVGRYGALHWVTTEALAAAMFGPNWNQQVDDISESFFSDYQFGSDVTDLGQFIPANEAAAAPTIDANL